MVCSGTGKLNNIGVTGDIHSLSVATCAILLLVLNMVYDGGKGKEVREKQKNDSEMVKNAKCFKNNLVLNRLKQTNKIKTMR